MIVPKYSVLPSLEKIDHHDQLPSMAVELGRIRNVSRANGLYIFVKRSNWLSILRVSERQLKTGYKYSCFQKDFPLAFLAWFPKALEDFCKPPAEGGLHAGAMSSIDYNVQGEMLCIQRSVEGYVAMNRSRNGRINQHASYMPTEIEFTETFLYDEGLLDLIKQLGEKYQKGLL